VQARTRTDQLFGALGSRHADVERNRKYEYARLQLAKGALVPSRVFDDTAAWTRTSGDVRLLEVQGRYNSGRYFLSARPDVPAPSMPADGRHAITLSRLADDVFRWDTNVDFAIGAIRPGEVAAVLTRLIGSAEGRSGGEAHAELRATAPRTSAALGTLFSLDSLLTTPLQDGSTATTLVVGLHSDRLRRSYPALGDYVRRYVDPTRFHIRVTDRAGVAYFDATLDERVLRIRLRSHRGALVPLSGSLRELPDTLLLLMDFKARFKHLGVGFHGLRVEVEHVRRGATENGWVLTAKEEPDWDFPLVMARLIRAPLRRPFSGDGSVFRIGVRGDGGGPTVIYRQIRLYVQESAILRFLNALGGTAFTEFEDRVDRDENAWLRVVFAAMREDARAALAP
jgi:hypothetical protein